MDRFTDSSRLAESREWFVPSVWRRGIWMGWGRMNSSKQHEGSRLSSNDYGLSARRLAGWAAIAATMLSTLAPVAEAQQQINPGSATAGLPSEPAPNATLPLYMRPGTQDFRNTPSHFPNPIAPYLSSPIESPSVFNSPRLTDLLKNGKIYLSLSDAVMLALENNFDIAIARYNLNIADTDIVRSRAGASLFGVPTGLVTGTLGGSSSTLVLRRRSRRHISGRVRCGRWSEWPGFDC